MAENHAQASFKTLFKWKERDQCLNYYSVIDAIRTLQATNVILARECDSSLESFRPQFYGIGGNLATQSDI